MYAHGQQKLTESSDGLVETGEVSMFGTIKSLIPEPRQADQPRRYVGRHRQHDALPIGTDVDVDTEADAATVAAGMEQRSA